MAVKVNSSLYSILVQGSVRGMQHPGRLPALSMAYLKLSLAKKSGARASHFFRMGP